jgi:hypothetical protein
MKNLVTGIWLLLTISPAAAQGSPDSIDLCQHVRHEPDGSITITGPITIGGATLTDQQIVRGTMTVGDTDYFDMIDKACPVSRPTDQNAK